MRGQVGDGGGVCEGTGGGQAGGTVGGRQGGWGDGGGREGQVRAETGWDKRTGGRDR